MRDIDDENVVDPNLADDAADDVADPADDAADDVADPSDDAADDAADPADDAADDVADPAPQRKETRVQRLANEARREREGRIAAEARLQEIDRTRTAAPDTSAEAARVRAEKLSLMEPAEREAFETKEELKKLKDSQQITQLQIADYSDKAAYERKAVSSPVYAKHQQWVENALAEARRKGMNPSREVLLKIKIGEEALSAKPKKAAKVAAGVRVAGAKGTSTSVRSDVSTKGGKGGEETVDSLREKILAREARGET